MKPVAPVISTCLADIRLLLHGAKHAVVVEQRAENGVVNRHRETKTAVAKIMMSDAGAPRQKPPR
jgi:hypothetical protein